MKEGLEISTVLIFYCGIFNETNGEEGKGGSNAMLSIEQFLIFITVATELFSQLNITTFRTSSQCKVEMKVVTLCKNMATLHCASRIT